jgi:hypothetical protein
MSQPNEPKAITLEQLPDLREKTEQVSQFLTKRLKSHINTLAPLFASRRVFGRYLGGKDAVPRADEAYKTLTDKYREVCGAPFDLRSDLDDDALAALENGIEVYPWEYAYSVQGKQLTVTSPVRWILTYKSDYSISEMRSVLSRTGDRRPGPIRQFVVNALGMQIVTSRNTGALSLLDDLRYDVKADPFPGLGKLPFVTINARIQSFRPSDDMMLAATRLSGVPAFIELIDPETIAQLQDPLRTQLESIIR